MFFFYTFIMGTCIGSFLNVVILRYGTGFSAARGRSECFSCGKKLAFWELIPLLSFLVLRGKCSSCKTPISWQYPLVEFFTGVLFALLGYKFLRGEIPTLLFPMYAALFAVLIAIAVYDLRHKIIPDHLVWVFNILTFITALYRTMLMGGVEGVLRYQFVIAGPLFFLPFFMLWYFSEGRLIGLGDGKLAIGMGFLLGIAYGLSAFAIAFWVGAVVALIMLFLGKVVSSKRISFLWLKSLHLTMKSEIPFAPFLIGATMFIFFYPLDIFSLHLFGF
jgi:prepilin signal peptidase PulO-like enzyme (type II secretory pathway)